MKIKRLSIQNSFDATLKDSNLENLGIDISELAIDSILEDGLLKEVPIVGTIVNFTKFSANVHDRLFLKKILTFLNNLKDVPMRKRSELIENINRSKKYRIKLGEKLLYIIDSCEDYEISELIGFLFKAFTEGRITYDEFLKSASILKNLHISDFNWFIQQGEDHRFQLDDVGDLISSGLFELSYEQLDVRVEDEDDYKTLRESPSSKYKTNIEGGGIGVQLSLTGEILLKIFSTSYQPKGDL